MLLQSLFKENNLYSLEYSLEKIKKRENEGVKEQYLMKRKCILQNAL